MSSALQCWHCGRALDDQPLPVVRSSTCPACDSDLHVCRMCEYYAPSVAKSCREPVAEEVRDKTRANFCDYFRVRPGAHHGDAKAAAARASLEALFGVDGEVKPSSTTAPDPRELEARKQREADEAADALRKLFGVGDDAS